MVSAIAQTSNTLLIGPIADKYSVWSSFRAAKPPQNNMKRGGKIIEAILYFPFEGCYQPWTDICHRKLDNNLIIQA